MTSLWFLILTTLAFAGDWVAHPVGLDEARELKRYGLSTWFAEDGTMMLNPGEVRKPFYGFKETTAANDNGILFAAEFYWLLRSHGILDESDAKRFRETVKKLEVRDNKKRPIKGLYHRNPGRSERFEAHDNFVGIVSASSLMGAEFADEIVSYGEKHKFVYNNLEPDHTGIMAITQWRQGGEIAFYQMVAGKEPGTRDLWWLFLTFIDGSFSSVDNASGNLLEWLRIKALEERMTKPMSPRLRKSFNLLKPAIWLWKETLVYKTKGEGMHWYFKLYFGGRNPENPLVPLSKGILY